MSTSKYPYQVEMYDDYIAGGAPQEFLSLEDDVYFKLLDLSRRRNMTVRQYLDMLVREYLPQVVEELQDEKEGNPPPEGAEKD